MGAVNRGELGFIVQHAGCQNMHAWLGLVNSRACHVFSHISFQFTTGFVFFYICANIVSINNE